MIHAFLTDTSMHNTSGNQQSHDSINRGVGYLDDMTVNYFLHPTVINDPRANRLVILATRVAGRLGVHFDLNRFSEIDFNDLTESQMTELFNIIEYITITQGMTAGDMNAHMTSNPSTYGMYVDGSLDASADVINIPIALSNGTTTDVDIRKKLVFKVEIGLSEISFNLWLSDASFREEYPYTTITRIVYPCDPVKILDPDYVNVIAAIVDTANYMNGIVHEEVSTDDHNGVMIFHSRYNTDQYVGHYQLPFGLLYKGPYPSGAQARYEIRTHLDSLGITSQEVWRALLPDVFVVGSFYLLPTWGNTYEHPVGDLERGIVNHNYLYELARITHPNFDPTFLRERLEVIKAAASDHFIAAVPSPENDSEYTMLRNIHPTYQPVDATHPRFMFQAQLTREFNIRMNDAIAQLRGHSNGGSFLDEEYQGRNYFVFVSYYVEYYVLKPDSYPVM